MYTPKNKIITNQYTGGGTLVIKSNGDPYTGFYYKTSDGKYFSGKTPNDPPNIELETSLSSDSPDIIPIQSRIAYGQGPTVFDSITDPLYNEEMVIQYSFLNKIDLNKPQPKLLPSSYFPSPTEDDYKLGVFTRYFCVKINEDKYIELSKEVYDKLVGKDSEYLWEPYTPFKLQWTITGELDYVVNTNRNIILLTEKRLKRKGLDIFLRKNYGKFYST